MDDKSVQQLWGSVLAGGEGTRVRSFLRQLCGRDGIKQFCAVIGSRSMLERTLTRVERLIPRERILVSISRGHQAEAQVQQVTAHPFRANQDVQGFTTQALTHLDCVYNLAVWISRDTGEAEDLLQETYRQAVRSFHRLQPATNYRVWLLSILRHIYINRYQQKGQGSEGVELEKINRAYKSMIEQGGSTADLFSQLTDHEIATVLKELPEEYRTAIVLVDIEKLSYEEASEVMACSLEVIRSRLSRGRRMLQVAVQNSVRMERADERTEHGAAIPLATERGRSDRPVHGRVQAVIRRADPCSGPRGTPE